MKKKLVALLAVLSTICALGACAFDGAVSFDESSSSNGGSVSESESSSESASDSDSSSAGSDADKHVYTAFTEAESTLFSDAFGFVIPFAANDEYHVEEYVYYYEDTNESEVGLNFYAYDLTQAEFDAYKGLFTMADGYTSDGTDVDSYGDTWYYFTKNDHYIDFAYYVTEDGSYVVDVYVYDMYEGDLRDGAGDNGGATEVFTEFTAEEKALFEGYFGFVIPFAQSTAYFVKDYATDIPDAEMPDEYLAYVNYYTFGNTQAEFNAYKAQFSTANGYTFVEEYADDYGDTCYVYEKNGAYVDICYYAYVCRM